MALTESNCEPSATSDVLDSPVNLNSLYCTHLWTNSNLRNNIITSTNKNKEGITYCYTCKGKIRKYELQPSRSFTPYNHSTPNKENMSIDTDETSDNGIRRNSVGEYPKKTICSYNRRTSTDSTDPNADDKQYIPSISQQIDSNIIHRFKSNEINTNDIDRGRIGLKESLNGIGCIINLDSLDVPVKKSIRLQACSISVMIIAIVIISFILVNYSNSNFKVSNKFTSTIVVPTDYTKSNETVSAATSVYPEFPEFLNESKSIKVYLTTTEYPITPSNKNKSLLNNVISKIRKNIRTYPRSGVKHEDINKPKEINNRDLSKRFCACQKNEICMLDENSGTAICRIPIDDDDPTGCGGLCALETEACHLVDKTLGVRVCRLLTPMTCSAEQWRCRNGLCVPASARCDGSIECYDRSDEMNCECNLTKQFRCGHSISCFPNTKKCDGIIDCWDGFDEVNCTTECPRNQFTCNDSQCILAMRFCDGFVDCADGSDEPHGCDKECGEHELRCANKRCVPRFVRCDGYDNCGDATDEIRCSTS